MALSAPFPYFGGKKRIAAEAWAAFGDVQNYVEPFAGSLAVLLARPEGWTGIETVNDKDGFVANFWRALAADPEAIAHWADWPVNENDQHARHAWLVQRRETLTAQLEGDPEYYDAKIAGWWVWGINCWIGGGWCSGDGPWRVDEHRQLVRDPGHPELGVKRKLVHLGDAGQGIHRQLVHLGDAGQGVHRKLVQDDGASGLLVWCQALAARLRYVRVCCGDWARICGPTPTVQHGLTGVLLDPPYDEVIRDGALYATETVGIAKDVAAWAREHGDDPLLRIVLCGYEGEHDMPSSWRIIEWKAPGGYGSQGQERGRENAHRERLWLSPHCCQTGETYAQVTLESLYG